MFVGKSSLQTGDMEFEAHGRLPKAGYRNDQALEPFAASQVVVVTPSLTQATSWLITLARTVPTWLSFTLHPGWEQLSELTGKRW